MRAPKLALVLLAVAAGPAAGRLAAAQPPRSDPRPPAAAAGAAANPPTSIYPAPTGTGAGAGAGTGAAAPMSDAPALRGRLPAGPAPAAPVGPPSVADLPALALLRGGGDAAPMCRAQCAGDLYRCASGGDGEGCHPAYAACRATCDISSPQPGRLVSPLPQAGLAPAGPLRSLPGALGGSGPSQ